MGTRGTLPKSDNYRLMVTGTTRGSFGFKLEEVLSDETLSSPVKESIEQAMAVIESAIEPDDVLEGFIDKFDPRVIKSIKKFIDIIGKNEALCTIEFGERTLKLATKDQIQQIADNLGHDVLEEEKEIVGTFQGVLPFNRQFEFQVKETGNVIRGRGGEEIGDMSNINEIIGKPTKIRVKVKKTGNWYTLLDYEATPE